MRTASGGKRNSGVDNKTRRGSRDLGMANGKVVRTKAFYKHRWQEEEVESRIRRCQVLLRRIKGPVTTKPPAARPPSEEKPMEVIVLSSDSEPEATSATTHPPIRRPSSIPATPSPIVSPCHDADHISTPPRNWSGFKAYTLVDQSDTDEEVPQTRQNPRLVATRETEETVPRRIASAVVVPSREEVELAPVPSESYEPLPEEIKRGLQPYLRAGVRLRVPGKQYKRVVLVGNRYLRILINRQGKAFIRPCGGSRGQWEGRQCDDESR
ncbi:uncharacterized protein LOC142229936 [Haematobia irritans]|uniref:uncharacterized protein LOC142229936 n=1 Tax=Haematobia irritans TaxID=7368 RepID=UPI003F4FF3D0